MCWNTLYFPILYSHTAPQDAGGGGCCRGRLSAGGSAAQGYATLPDGGRGPGAHSQLLRWDDQEIGRFLFNLMHYTNDLENKTVATFFNQ